MHTIISTKRLLGELKWANNKELMRWLVSAGMFVKVDQWKTKRSKKIGSLVNIQPTLVWKEGLQIEIEKGPKETTCEVEKKKWQIARGSAESVPEFKLLQENKSFGAEANRVTAKSKQRRDTGGGCGIHALSTKRCVQTRKTQRMIY